MADLHYRQLLEANYRTIRAVVARVARRQGLSPDEADELLSTVHLRLVQNGYAVLRKFSRRCQLATYLTIVVSRISIDCRRARWRRRMVPIDTMIRVPRALMVEPACEADADTRPADHELARALAALGEHDRRLIALRYEANWTVQRIARELGLKPKATYRRFEKILRTLRTLLMVGWPHGDRLQSHRAYRTPQARAAARV